MPQITTASMYDPFMQNLGPALLSALQLHADRLHSLLTGAGLPPDGSTEDCVDTDTAHMSRAQALSAVVELLQYAVVYDVSVPPDMLQQLMQLRIAELVVAVLELQLHSKQPRLPAWMCKQLLQLYLEGAVPLQSVTETAARVSSEGGRLSRKQLAAAVEELIALGCRQAAGTWCNALMQFATQQQLELSSSTSSALVCTFWGSDPSGIRASQGLGRRDAVLHKGEGADSAADWQAGFDAACVSVTQLVQQAMDGTSLVAVLRLNLTATAQQVLVKHAVASDMAQRAVSTTEWQQILQRIRAVALHLVPERNVALQLLDEHAAEPVAADALRQLVLLASSACAPGPWCSLSQRVLAALHALPPAGQVQVLQKGGAVAVAKLLLLDAADQEAFGLQPAAVGGGPLAPLLQLLACSAAGQPQPAGGAVAAEPQPAAEAMRSADWKALLTLLIHACQQLPDTDQDAASVIKAEALMCDAQTIMHMALDVESQPLGSVELACWTAKQALVGEASSLGTSPCLKLAHQALAALQQAGWNLGTPSISSGDDDNSRADVLKEYCDLISWVATTPAVSTALHAAAGCPGNTRSSRDVTQGEHTALPWLLPLLGDMCSAMALSCGYVWALKLPSGSGAAVEQPYILAAHAAAKQSSQQAVLDVIEGFKTNVRKKLPPELITVALESVVTAAAWEYGAVLLPALGLPHKDWVADAAVHEACTRLHTPAAKSALLALLLHQEEEQAQGAPEHYSTAVRRCSLVAELLPRHLPPCLDTTMRVLEARQAAAQAAAEGLAAGSALDPLQQCVLARQELLGGLLQLPQKTATGDQAYATQILQACRLLLSVYDAAGRHFESIGFVLELSEGTLQLFTHSLGSEAVHELAATAMAAANAAGAYQGSLIMFLQLLQQGPVSSSDVVKEALCACSCLGPHPLAGEVVQAVGGEEAYLELQVEVEVQGGQLGRAVEADRGWLRTRQKRQATGAWRQELEELSLELKIMAQT